MVQCLHRIVGSAGMDVVKSGLAPGGSAAFSEGRQHSQRVDSVLRWSAAFSDGRQRSQMVGSVLRWSAAFSDGRQRSQMVGSVLRGSAAFSEGPQRSQRVGSVLRGSAAFSEGRHCGRGLPDVITTDQFKVRYRNLYRRVL